MAASLGFPARRRGCRFSLPLVVLLILLLLAGGEPVVAGDDRDTLLAVSKDWGGPPQLESWNPSTAPNHCTWTGVTCNDASGVGGVVTGLALSRLNLTGSVPASVCALNNLTDLDLSYNNLTGAFPAPALYACAELRFLDLSNNNFSGPLPRDIDRLSPAMEHLNLSSNTFAGEVPPAVASFPALKSLLLDTNHFTGAYPTHEISNLTGLETLTLANNGFAPAPVPEEFAKLTNLAYLWMDKMNLTGEIPGNFSRLTELTVFSVASNKLTGTIPASLCALNKNLTRLDLSYNNLTGAFPAAALYACKKLRFLDISNNHFSGPLPRHIDRLSPAMEHLNLSTNSFSGEIPPAVGRLAALMSLVLYNNRFSGKFPEKIWSSLPKLNQIMIQNNGFTGTLPAQISSKILWIEMGNNIFSGSFPISAPEVKVFHAENNQLGGELPSDMSKLSSLTDLSVPGNQITGSIPASIKLLRKLSTLDLSGNRLSGAIPAGSIGLLRELTKLDLSDNLLTGGIPSDISSHIKELNLSSNQLTGEVPEQLQNNAAYNKSFVGNLGLCARAGSAINLPTCRDGGRGARGKRLKIILFAMLAAGIAIGIIIAACWLFFRQRRKVTDCETTAWKMQAFTQVNFTESDVLSNIHEENVIGIGGSSKVYRFVHLGRTLAVKSISDPTNYQEFEAEVKVLGNTLRHNNIVRLLCCISGGPEAKKLLVYEYMEKGSLDRWLHRPAGDGAPLDWPTRLAIAIDAAKGLSYMHHECADKPIVHCDVKSSNILLGPGFHAKIGDFGLAQALCGEPGSLPAAVGGTHGYMAPEILQGAQANDKLDVYSFGVVLLELTTGKKATDGGGIEGMGLAGWARRRYLQEEEGFDDDMVDEAIRRDPSDMQAIQSVFTLGLMCTSENPPERPSMEQVLHQLMTAQQCQRIVRAETTTSEAFQQVVRYEDDEGDEGGGAPLLQSRRRSTWLRRRVSSLLRCTSMVISSRTSRRRSTLSGSSQQGLELLQRKIRGSSEPRAISFAQMHGERAHTN